MTGLPVVLDVHGRTCVVAGAGKGGRRKAAALLAAGASVIVIDPDGTDLEGVVIHRRVWADSDADGAFIVAVATDDAAANQAIAHAAAEAGALVLRADAGLAGDVRLPAVARLGSLTVAVDSGGTSPALAAVARTELKAVLDAEASRWDELAMWAGAQRPVSVGEVESKLAAMRGVS